MPKPIRSDAGEAEKGNLLLIGWNHGNLEEIVEVQIKNFTL